MNTPPQPDQKLSHNAPIYSVGEISTALKRTVQENFGRVRVRGEVSGLKQATSGHIYFGLKDVDAVLDAVCWRNKAAKLSFEPMDGLEVICTGQLTTYPSRSRYQIIIDHIEPAGVAALMQLLEERRALLSAEGLFDPSNKQPIPYLPEVIGIITSESGAVIRDIMHRLRDRFPRKVILWPVRVQGTGAANEIAEAINGFNSLSENDSTTQPSLLIVARGGGSIEDLWPFNEEIVVRAAANSHIPLISAIGHETDTTLIDLAADQRAPTPSTAAELAVPMRSDLVHALTNYRRRLTGTLTNRITSLNTELRATARGLHNPYELLDISRQRLDELSDRLSLAMKMHLERIQNGLATLRMALQPHHPGAEIKRMRLQTTSLEHQLQREIQLRITHARRTLDSHKKLLESLSYHRILERGFTVVRDENNRTITEASSIKTGTALKVEFHDGNISVISGKT